MVGEVDPGQKGAGGDDIVLPSDLGDEVVLPTLAAGELAPLPLGELDDGLQDVGEHVLLEVGEDLGGSAPHLPGGGDLGIDLRMAGLGVLCFSLALLRGFLGRRGRGLIAFLALLEDEHSLKAKVI